MVEFASILPVVSIFLFGVVQYGLIFSAYITVRNASAAGARYSILSFPVKTDAQIISFTKAAVTPSLQSNSASVVVTRNVNAGSANDAISVRVTYSYPTMLPVPGASGGLFPLSATTTVR